MKNHVGLVGCGWDSSVQGSISHIYIYMLAYYVHAVRKELLELKLCDFDICSQFISIYFTLRDICVKSI
jgi:hypothetical protein